MLSIPDGESIFINRILSSPSYDSSDVAFSANTISVTYQTNPTIVYVKNKPTIYKQISSTTNIISSMDLIQLYYQPNVIDNAGIHINGPVTLCFKNLGFVYNIFKKSPYNSLSLAKNARANNTNISIPKGKKFHFISLIEGELGSGAMLYVYPQTFLQSSEMGGEFYPNKNNDIYGPSVLYIAFPGGYAQDSFLLTYQILDIEK
jgi:hypothetical protein